MFSVTYCCYVAWVELRGILQKGESWMSVNNVLSEQENMTKQKSKQKDKDT